MDRQRIMDGNRTSLRCVFMMSASRRAQRAYTDYLTYEQPD